MPVDLDAVLKEVNIIRQHSLDLPSITEIPKGRPFRASLCPLARAFEATGLNEGVLLKDSPQGVRRYFVRRSLPEEFHNVRRKYKEIILPSILNEFVTEYDQGLHPQYDLVQR